MFCPRAVRAISMLLTASILSACGGGGGGSALPAVQKEPTDLNVTVAGNVLAVDGSSRFSLQSGDGQQFTVVTSPSTVVDTPPYVGESVEVTGTNQPPATIAASKVKHNGGNPSATPTPKPTNAPTVAPTLAPTPVPTIAP